MARVTEAHGKRLPRRSQRRKASRRILARWMIYVRQRDALSLQVTSLTRHAEPWNKHYKGYEYFQQYVKGMGKAPKAYSEYLAERAGRRVFLARSTSPSVETCGRRTVHHACLRGTRLSAVDTPAEPGHEKTQISRFFYYSTRGAPGFDSGLLEPATVPAGAKPKRKIRPNHPRSIYGIYAKKTPKS